MKKVLFLAIKDLQVLLSDKGNIFWVFGFPIMFALFFGAIYSGASEGPSEMKIAMVDEDKSEFSNSYISKLESDEALNIIPLGRDEAIEQVRKGKVAAAVVEAVMRDQLTLSRGMSPTSVSMSWIEDMFTPVSPTSFWAQG